MFITVQCRIFCETKQQIYIFPNKASNQFCPVCHQKGEDMHFLDYYAMYIRLGRQEIFFDAFLMSVMFIENVLIMQRTVINGVIQEDDSA